MLGNIGSLLSDLDFWGGVATGASQQIDIQEEQKDRNYRELRKFGMERGLQISDDNTKMLDDAEKQVKELASMISGNRSATSPEAMEAAFYLIENEGGIAGAAKVASSLQTEFSTYGVDPIAKLGLTERVEGTTPTARQIGRSFTKLKPLPDLSSSGISVENTALDVIFGVDSAEKSIQSEMEGMFGQQEPSQTIAAMTTEGFDKELILGENFKNELKRMNVLLNKHNRVPINNRDAAWKNTENTIKLNIDMLKEAEKLSKLETQTMSDSTRTSLEKGYLGTLLLAHGLNGEWQQGFYIPQGVQANIVQTAEDAISTMGSLVQLARNNGYVGKVEGDEKEYDPLEFIKKFGAALGNRIILVTPEVGDPYLSIGKQIFSDQLKGSKSWAQSIVQGGASQGGTRKPPVVGNSNQQPSTGSATGQGSSIIPDSLLTNVKSQVPSTRKAAANAIMTRLKNANTTMNQVQLEALFDITTGISWNVASK